MRIFTHFSPLRSLYQGHNCREGDWKKATKFGEAKCIESALITISFESLHFLPAASFWPFPIPNAKKSPSQFGVKAGVETPDAGEEIALRRRKERKQIEKNKENRERESAGEKKGLFAAVCFRFSVGVVRSSAIAWHGRRDVSLGRVEALYQSRAQEFEAGRTTLVLNRASENRT